MKAKSKKPSGVVKPLELKQKPDDYIPMDQRPVAVQKYVREIAALQDEAQQDKEVPMDQSSDYNLPSEVGSSGRSMHLETSTEMRRAAHATLEVAGSTPGFTGRSRDAI